MIGLSEKRLLADLDQHRYCIIAMDSACCKCTIGRIVHSEWGFPRVKRPLQLQACLHLYICHMHAYEVFRHHAQWTTDKAPCAAAYQSTWT